MTIAQVWKNAGELKGRMEGKLEGERNKARLMVLRGKWKDAPNDFLIYQSELPLEEVNNLFKAYDEVLRSWQRNKNISIRNAQTAYLTELEVAYLLDLFNMFNRWY